MLVDGSTSYSLGGEESWGGGGGGKGLITHLQINSGSGLLGCLRACGMGWGGDL